MAVDTGSYRSRESLISTPIYSNPYYGDPQQGFGLLEIPGKAWLPETNRFLGILGMNMDNNADYEGPYQEFCQVFDEVFEKASDVRMTESKLSWLFVLWDLFIFPIILKRSIILNMA